MGHRPSPPLSGFSRVGSGAGLSSFHPKVKCTGMRPGKGGVGLTQSGGDPAPNFSEHPDKSFLHYKGIASQSFLLPAGLCFLLSSLMGRGKGRKSSWKHPVELTQGVRGITRATGALSTPSMRDESLQETDRQTLRSSGEPPPPKYPNLTTAKYCCCI